MAACDYSPGVVAQLLPVAFDPDRGWGAQVGENIRPDADMPRAAKDPSKGGTVWCMCADVQRAWGSLSERQRRIVYARYVQDASVNGIARALGLHYSTVEESLFYAVRRMCFFLNGRHLDDGFDLGKKKVLV